MLRGSRVLNESNVREYVDKYLNMEGIAIEVLKNGANKLLKEIKIAKKIPLV